MSINLITEINNFYQGPENGSEDGIPAVPELYQMYTDFYVNFDTEGVATIKGNFERCLSSRYSLFVYPAIKAFRRYLKQQMQQFPILEELHFAAKPNVSISIDFNPENIVSATPEQIRQMLQDKTPISAVIKFSMHFDTNPVSYLRKQIEAKDGNTFSEISHALWEIGRVKYENEFLPYIEAVNAFIEAVLDETFHSPPFRYRAKATNRIANDFSISDFQRNERTITFSSEHKIDLIR